VECVLVIPVYVTSWGTSPCIMIECELMYREDRLAKAIWNRGTEVRLKRFLAKAKRGEGFTVGVVGGSGRSFNPILQSPFPLPTSCWRVTSWCGYITTHLAVGIN
jgi:hypothetical protein